MTSKGLDKFGVLRRAFQGAGLIRFQNGEEFEAQFTLAQHYDGQLLFSADLARPIWDFFGRQFEVESLTGTLSDGRPVNLLDPIFLKETSPSNSGTRLVGFPSRWAIGQMDFDSPAFVTFELVNFLFLGTEVETVTRDGLERSTLSLLPLNLGGTEVEVRWSPDYKQVESTLRAQKGVQVTCIVRKTIHSAAEVGDAESAIEALCNLMSVARGTLVSWTSYDIHASNEAPYYSFYRNSVTRRYAGIQLIQDHRIHETKSFLEEGFKLYGGLDEEYQMGRVARAYTEARAGPFLETRSMLIAVLAEYLAGVRARLENHTLFLLEEEFENGLESLKGKVRQALTATYHGISKKYTRAMLANLRGFNRRPLSWKLNSLARWLELEFGPNEINDFVTLRNSLAHTASFPKKKPPVEYYKQMLHFLDRVILRLFDYRGSYYDIEHNRIAEL